MKTDNITFQTFFQICNQDLIHNLASLNLTLKDLDINMEMEEPHKKLVVDRFLLIDTLQRLSRTSTCN
jgi:hypothetical protein